MFKIVDCTLHSAVCLRWGYSASRITTRTFNHSKLNYCRLLKYLHTCKYKNLSCDILWKESSGTFRMWLSLRSKVIIALKLWNANSGSLVKYRALDIFKCCKALPTSLKASLWITDIRLLLKSILEMLGTCANAFLSMLTILALTWKQIKYSLLIKDLYRTHAMFSPILRQGF